SRGETEDRRRSCRMRGPQAMMSRCTGGSIRSPTASTVRLGPRLRVRKISKGSVEKPLRCRWRRQRNIDERRSENILCLVSYFDDVHVVLCTDVSKAIADAGSDGHSAKGTGFRSERAYIDKITS